MMGAKMLLNFLFVTEIGAGQTCDLTLPLPAYLEQCVNRSMCNLMLVFANVYTLANLKMDRNVLHVRIILYICCMYAT
jgi:hypothetical protein